MFDSGCHIKICNVDFHMGRLSGRQIVHGGGGSMCGMIEGCTECALEKMADE